MQKRPLANSNGFSLTEIVIALGVAAFALSVASGLLSHIMNSADRVNRTISDRVDTDLMLKRWEAQIRDSDVMVSGLVSCAEPTIFSRSAILGGTVKASFAFTAVNDAYSFAYARDRSLASTVDTDNIHVENPKAFETGDVIALSSLDANRDRVLFVVESVNSGTGNMRISRTLPNLKLSGIPCGLNPTANTTILDPMNPTHFAISRLGFVKYQTKSKNGELALVVYEWTPKGVIEEPVVDAYKSLRIDQTFTRFSSDKVGSAMDGRFVAELRLNYPELQVLNGKAVEKKSVVQSQFDFVSYVIRNTAGAITPASPDLIFPTCAVSAQEVPGVFEAIGKDPVLGSDKPGRSSRLFRIDVQFTETQYFDDLQVLPDIFTSASGPSSVVCWKHTALDLGDATYPFHVLTNPTNEGSMSMIEFDASASQQKVLPTIPGQRFAPLICDLPEGGTLQASMRYLATSATGDVRQVKTTCTPFTVEKGPATYQFVQAPNCAGDGNIDFGQLSGSAGPTEYGPALYTHSDSCTWSIAYSGCDTKGAQALDPANKLLRVRLYPFGIPGIKQSDLELVCTP